jgi:hypothetical protein
MATPLNSARIKLIRTLTACSSNTRAQIAGYTGEHVYDAVVDRRIWPAEEVLRAVELSNCVDDMGLAIEAAVGHLAPSLRAWREYKMAREMQPASATPSTQATDLPPPYSVRDQAREAAPPANLPGIPEAAERLDSIALVEYQRVCDAHATARTQIRRLQDDVARLTDENARLRACLARNESSAGGPHTTSPKPLLVPEYMSITGSLQDLRDVLGTHLEDLPKIIKDVDDLWYVSFLGESEKTGASVVRGCLTRCLENKFANSLRKFYTICPRAEVLLATLCKVR